MKYILLASLFLSVASSLRAQEIERPPQFVMISFDGSKSESMWQSTLDFADQMKDQGRDVNFTYFISGVYFLVRKRNDHGNPLNTHRLYDAPTFGKGRSWIGFGDSRDGIKERVRFMNRATRAGHEIGSHANGHFNAAEKNWSEANWTQEFNEFNKLVFGYAENNEMTGDIPHLLIRPTNIKGIRAPNLGVTNGLWTTLKKFNYTYDASEIRPTNYWPKKKQSGTWNFPLASLKIAGTGKRTLSMDYNFYYAQSKAKKADASNYQNFKHQMVETYRKYFYNNYYGNRAPLHIGHHFSLWNGGTYWQALQDVIVEICGLPEVVCGTYQQLVTFMEQNKDKINDFEKGRFEKFERGQETLAELEPTYDIDVQLAMTSGSKVQAFLSGQDKNSQVVANSKVQWTVNDQVVSEGTNQLDLNQVNQIVEGEDVVLRFSMTDQEGVEIQSYSTRLNASANEFRQVGISGESRPVVKLGGSSFESQMMKGHHRGAHAEDDFDLEGDLMQNTDLESLAL